MNEQLREEPLIQVRKPRNRAEAEYLLRVAGFLAKDINRILDEAFPNASPATVTAPAGGVTDQQIKDLSEKDEFWRLLPGYEPERRYELDAVAFGRAVIALTTAARAAEPAYHCIGFIEQYGRMIGDTQQGKQTIPVYVRAASPTPPMGTSKERSEK